MSTALKQPSALLSLPVVLACLALLLAVLAQASVMEDAYITFRVVDNFIHGEGLRWNLHERVQAYTNPLWMFLHIPFYLVSDNIFLLTIALGVLCTGIAMAAALLTFAYPPLAMACLFIVPLAASRSFAVYSTSGFENSLGHALFACFGYVLVKRPPRFWFWLSLFTALSMVNRLDTAVLYAPVWGYFLWSRQGRLPWRDILLGALPIILWEAFSLWYYGFLFPNTKYAKLNTGVDSSQYLELGRSYVLNLIAIDFPSALLLLAAAAMAPWLLTRYCKTREDGTGAYLGVAAGALLYVAYIYVVGGTYLSGRLFTLPVFVSAWLALALLPPLLRERNMVILAAALASLALFYPPQQAVQSVCQICFRGVDPVFSEVKDTLADYLAGKVRIPDPGSRRIPEDVKLEWSMGKWGWSLDRRVKVVDGFAIVDPLLARLPMNMPTIQTMGITGRSVPPGYMEFLKTGDMSKMDPQLAAYYSKLHLIVAGDLWSLERLGEIVKFNLGAYDYLRDEYVRNTRRP